MRSESSKKGPVYSFLQSRLFQCVSRARAADAARPSPATRLGSGVLPRVDEAEIRFFDVPDPSFPDLRPVLRRDALVLDAGCGRGRNLEHLERQGFRSIALDCDAEHLAHVRATGRTTVVQGDLFALPLSDASVDAVVAWQVLCQFSPPQAQLLFAQMHRVLTAGGLLILAGCYGSASPRWGFSADRGIDSCLVLPAIFDPVRSQILEPVPGWPGLRWLYIAHKAGSSKVHVPPVLT